MGKPNNHLPDRWTDYTPLGKRIPGTRFIAFKVPLKKIFNSRIEPWQRFSSADLIRDVQGQKEELGLIIDLTCTTRYYSPEELPESLCYAKIFTAGHEVPSDDTIFQFKCIVNQFLKDNSNNDKLIGVHCTHGLNRTGYLVCRYLIDVLGMVPSDAIEKFNQSRGHCIERKNYLDDLMCGEMRRNAETDKSLLPLPKYQQKMPNLNNPSVPPSLPPPHRPVQTQFSRFGNSVDTPTIPEPRPKHSRPPRHDMPWPMYNDPSIDCDSRMYPREADSQQFKQWNPHPCHYGYQPPSRNPNGYQPPSRNPNGYQPPSSNPHGYQPPSSNPDGYQPPSRNPYGYQPPSSNPHGYQPPSSNPHGYQPPSSNPHGYQPPSSNPHGYQPPSRNPHGYQPPSRNHHGYQPPSRYPGIPQGSTPWQSTSNGPYRRHPARGTKAKY